MVYLITFLHVHSEIIVTKYVEFMKYEHSILTFGEQQ